MSDIHFNWKGFVMSKALKLSLNANGEITCNKNSEWEKYNKEVKCQPDIFHTYNMCYPEDQTLTVFRSYIDKDMMCKDASNLSAAYNSCHILMVFNNTGFEILHVEKTCMSDHHSVQTALHAMLCEIGDMIGITL